MEILQEIKRLSHIDKLELSRKGVRPTVIDLRCILKRQNLR
jgi:hypothetical protein